MPSYMLVRIWLAINALYYETPSESVRRGGQIGRSIFGSIMYYRLPPFHIKFIGMSFLTKNFDF